MTLFKPTRRSLLAGSAAAFGLGASGMLRAAVAAELLAIGIVYFGPRGDFGWNRRTPSVPPRSRRCPT